MPKGVQGHLSVVHSNLESYAWTTIHIRKFENISKIRVFPLHSEVAKRCPGTPLTSLSCPFDFRKLCGDNHSISESSKIYQKSVLPFTYRGCQKVSRDTFQLFIRFYKVMRGLPSHIRKFEIYKKSEFSLYILRLPKSVQGHLFSVQGHLFMIFEGPIFRSPKTSRRVLSNRCPVGSDIPFVNCWSTSE